jgi:hypothetical protein
MSVTIAAALRDRITGLINDLAQRATAADPALVAQRRSTMSRSSRRSVASTATPTATAFWANREDLEPTIRLAPYLLALAALARRRTPAPAATSLRGGGCR